MLTAEAILYFVKDSVVAFALAAVLKYVFLEHYTGTAKKYVIAGAGAALYITLSYCFLVPTKENAYEILDALSNLFYFVFAFVFFKKPAVLRTIIVVFLCLFSADMLWSFVSPFFRANIFAELFCNILLFSCFGIVIRAIASSGSVNVLAGTFAELPKWPVAALLLFELTCYYRQFGISEKWYDLLYAVSGSLILISIIYLAFRLSKLIFTQSAILRQLNEQLLYSEELKRSDEQLRSFRHDLKNHVIVINSMFEQGDIQGAKKYFSQLSEENSSALHHFSTGNTVVDSLLDIKSSAASKNNTFIDFSGILPSKGIEAKDMCICVGNLIDNAIESCEKIDRGKQKTITVTGKYKNNTVIFTVNNPAAGANERFQTIKTSKADKRAHGIGLKNVQKIADKYNGSLSLERNNNMFTSVLLLQCQST